jgi:hypothetical protein
MNDASTLRDQVRTLLAEPLSDEQLRPIFGQVAQTFALTYPESVHVLHELEQKTTKHGQYRLAMEALLEVLDRATASEALADQYRAKTKELQARVDALMKFGSRVRRK